MITKRHCGAACSLAIGIALAAVAITAIAHGAHAAPAAPAYVCKMLPVTPDQLRDLSALPPVLAEPGGRVIGRATSIVYAVKPEHVVQGYQEVIGYTGAHGWVQASSLAPYRSASDPRAICPAPPWAAAP